MDAKKEIKEKALSLGARAAGVASVDEINRFAPAGHRPDDLLRGAKSVVVLGGGEPTAGAWRSKSNRVLGSIGYNRNQLASSAQNWLDWGPGPWGQVSYLTLPKVCSISMR